MDKKSIIGIVVVGVLFVGFVYFNGKEQKRYQTEMAEWQAYQDSVAAAQAAQVAPVAAADSTELAAPRPAAADSPASARLETVVGASLAAAAEAQPEEFAIENEVMTVRFSTSA